jgi:hypothetical protein
MSGHVDERHLQEIPGCLVLEYGPSTAQELGELYREFAVLCIERQIPQALVLIGEDRRSGELALRSAVTMMLLAGIPRDFKLALVATATGVAQAYRALEHDLCSAGVAARLFDSQQDAALWLDGPRERARSSTWQAAPPALA